MDSFFDALVPIVVVSGVCVVLPVLIVWLIARAATNSETQRSRVLIEAIKSGNMDTAALAAAMEKKKRTPHELLNLRLLRGCIFGLLGLTSLVFAVVFLCVNPGLELHNTFFILAGVFIPIGASYLVVYFVSRKNLPHSQKEQCAKVEVEEIIDEK